MIIGRPTRYFRSDFGRGTGGRDETNKTRLRPRPRSETSVVEAMNVRHLVQKGGQLFVVRPRIKIDRNEDLGTNPTKDQWHADARMFPDRGRRLQPREPRNFVGKRL